MKFRIQTDGEKFRVQEQHWYGWGCSHRVGYRIWVSRGKDGCRRVWEYQRFSTQAEAQAWIDQHQEPKRKWRTL